VGNEITIANGFGTGTNAVLVVATVNSGAVLTATVKPAAPGVLCNRWWCYRNCTTISKYW